LTLHGISRCHPSILFAVDSSTTAEGVSSPTLGDLETELQARREILAVLAKQDRHGFHNPIYRLVCVVFSASSSATRALSFAVFLRSGDYNTLIAATPREPIEPVRSRIRARVKPFSKIEFAVSAFRRINQSTGQGT